VAVEHLIKEKVQFDAVFACSDLLAMTATNTMRAAGIHVPHDVAIVGYDDIELAAHFHPPLTTIRQQIDMAGHTLVASLMSIVAGQGAAPTLLPTRLIVRETSG
jgi:DNA-binding LacI/PurR family transcriptional regulator